MRLKVFLTGLLLIFAVTGSLFLFGGDARTLLLAHVAAYGVVGVAVGFLWPKVGWRLGLWLVAPWFIMQIVTIPLADRGALPGDAKGLLGELAKNLLLVVAACFGAEVGAIIKRRRLADLSLDI
ncbi:MAG TPA: hypothetical protein VJ866_19635 [Pyrinomonadaceae bacterium]|nr:hypothetical protein [Pyrinomonadaceae bacterium]